MQDLRSAQTVIEKERANITDLSAEREPSTQRTTNLARLSELTAQHRQLSLKLKGYEDRDPTLLRLLGEQIDEKMEQAGRWGANLDCVRAYLESEMGMDAETFAGRFEVASQDYEPITWQNYASFLPAGNVPVSLFTASDLAPHVMLLIYGVAAGTEGNRRRRCFLVGRIFSSCITGQPPCGKGGHRNSC